MPPDQRSLGSADDVSPTDFIEPMVNPGAFAREQDALSTTWTFLGLASDLPHEGDWMRTSLASRPVFIQRSRGEIRGFENRCAHRSYPLRLTDRGNGPARCGFHHWLYDADGRARGIPKCVELFGKTPRELNASLKRLDVDVCGNLVFGRFPPQNVAPSLQDFLGPSFEILAAMSTASRPLRPLVRDVQANWRLCWRISLDDYHLAAVHPTTFGKVGYLDRDAISYHRFGDHSAYFTTSDPDGLENMRAACAAGSFISKNYRVFHIFPNFAAAHVRSDGPFWQIALFQYQPIAHDRSRLRAWIYPAPFAVEAGQAQRLLGALTQPVRSLLVRRYMARILREDNDVCQRLQSSLAAGMPSPIYGRLEERIAWFDEAYARTVAAGGSERSQ